MSNNDYRGFQDKMQGDLSQASVTAQGYGDAKYAKNSRVRIRQSDLETLIPSGSSVEFVPVACHKLKFGDIVFIRKDKEMSIRRFLAFEVVKRGTMVAVVRLSPPTVETYQDSAIVGKVVRVEAHGKTFDPLKMESLSDKLKNQWTCFGTSNPFQRMLNGARRFGKMMKFKN
jgi:hypothetical protein